MTIAIGNYVNIQAGALTTAQAGTRPIQEFEFHDTPETVQQWRTFLDIYADQPFARFERTPGEYMRLTHWGDNEEALQAIPVTVTVGNPVPLPLVRRVVPAVDDWISRFDKIEEGARQLLLGDHRPAVFVEDYEAVAYAAAVGGRLPTAYEHMYAARAGRDVEYGTNDGKLHFPDHDGQEANAHWDNDSTADVGTYAANPWELFDICGNTWEFCQMENDQIPALRGGGLIGNHGSDFLWDFGFGEFPPGFREFFIGFRVARSVA